MYSGKNALDSDGNRLYDSLVKLKQGDEDSYKSIISRFAGFINKSSYNANLGTVDDDLQAEIHLTLFLRLRRFKIPDAGSLNTST